MPNVPNVPGVPILSSYSVLPIALLISDAITFLGGFFFPQWGIFQFGTPVVTADNVVSVDFKQEWSISNYPVEQGGFESYDKVASPFEARVRFSTGGSLADRQEFLNSIAAIAGTLDLFDVVTPEAAYPSVNISHYDYRRTSRNGVGLLVVDVWCVEVRQNATTAFSDTQSPSGADPVNGGVVQGRGNITVRSNTTGQVVSGPIQ